MEYSIIKVIEVLGEAIINYKTQIACNEYEITKLKEKIEELERKNE